MNEDVQTQTPKNPSDWVRQILTEAQAKIQPNPWAMILATADKEGKPSSRTVLLKQFDEAGFVFFTNSQSRKGRHLADNPFASLTFYLPTIKKQIQVEGKVAMISPSESDDYWQTRPRESQIGAWASAQSRKIPDDEEFEERYGGFEKRFADSESIPRPAHWNGYRLVPTQIEIWMEGVHRLHRRYSYLRKNGSWCVSRLFP
ncbi:MAG: pyridoxamine 5'-phosphate oxidase [Deltaproteobacteria bacterium]|nr:pyridoxamine 5'-phosphate oxidase [Deltaproteobacteria bacterium]